MKHAFTRLLPLVVGLLLPGAFVQAQNMDALTVSKARKQPALSAQLALPVGSFSLHHALPLVGGAIPPRVAQQPLRAVSGSKQAIRDVEVRSQALANGPVSELWAARYNTPDNSYDAATSTTVDSFGNVYVTGYSFSDNAISSEGDYDYVTIKYSSQGQQQWLARYNGSSFSSVSDDVPKDIAVDAAGNVYVTGSSVGEGTRYDYATVKYSASGQQLWAARYNGPANSDDLAVSVAVDAAGNVLVTGASYNGPGTSYDYVTVKYSAVGQQQWATRYNSSGASDELPTSLALDGSGNVYVTGNAYANNQGDYLTLKYSPAGQAQWVARYNGPAGGYDLARDLAVDAAGNVAVTGTSDNGSSYDYATVRYNNSGQQLWATRYNGAGNSYDEATAVALDPFGNVLVTGYANIGGDNWDYVTLKYAAVGLTQWEARYNGPAGGYDEAKDVAVDAAGNVAVTGRSYNSLGLSEYATVKYAANGQSLWSARRVGTASGDEAAMAIATTADNVIVTGTSFAGNRNFDYATVRYSVGGEPLWVARYTGLATTGIPSQATDMAVDAAGNVAVTGRSRTSSGRIVYATVKYSASGQKLWGARFQVVVSIDTNPVVGMDAAGNVYIAGSSNNEYYTIKYDGASGQPLWTNRYFAGVLNRGNDVKDLAVDAAGNAYVTGASVMGFPTLYDYATIKYSPSGQQLWVSRYFGTETNSNDEPSRLTLDGAGNVYVTGVSTEQYNGTVYSTIKYSATGQQQWVARYDEPSRPDKATAIAVDVAGNVYVTGTSTLKYSPGGQLLWTAEYFSNGSAIAVDAAGDVLVTGTGYLNGNSSQGVWVTAKCAGASGQRLWQVFNGLGNTTDQAVDMAVDGAGDVYVTGTSVGGNTNYNTIKYAGASGQVLWETRNLNSSNTSNAPVSLVLDAARNVYVAGTSLSNYLTIKYTQASSAATAAVLATKPSLAVSGSGVQELAVYPNPAAGHASVSFRPVLDGAAQVQLYNQLGQQVATLYEGAVRKGQHYELPLPSEKLAPGLYTCSLLVKGQRETVRLVVSH